MYPLNFDQLKLKMKIKYIEKLFSKDLHESDFRIFIASFGRIYYICFGRRNRRNSYDLRIKDKVRKSTLLVSRRNGQNDNLMLYSKSKYFYLVFSFTPSNRLDEITRQTFDILIQYLYVSLEY